jgi:hypothetical protein
MATKKQQERKKQNKKLKSRARVLARRKWLRDQRKKEKVDQIRFETEYELKNGKEKPFSKTPPEESDNKMKDEAIKAKLENNLKILEALEQEYLKEKEQKEKMVDSISQDEPPQQEKNDAPIEL